MFLQKSSNMGRKDAAEFAFNKVNVSLHLLAIAPLTAWIAWEQWDFENNEETKKHSNRWIVIDGTEQDFQNNEKKVGHSDHLDWMSCMENIVESCETTLECSDIWMGHYSAKDSYLAVLWMHLVWLVCLSFSYRKCFPMMQLHIPIYFWLMLKITLEILVSPPISRYIWRIAISNFLLFNNQLLYLHLFMYFIESN